MAANYSYMYLLNANAERVCSLLRDARFYSFLQLEYRFEAPIQGGTTYRFSSGVTLSSWGENIDINVLYLNETTSQVIIKSECALPTQIIDWGKNKANVEKIYNHLFSTIAYNPAFNNVSSQPEMNQAPVQNQNIAQPQQSPAGVFCKKCNTQLDPVSRFCHICGTPVI